VGNPASMRRVHLELFGFKGNDMQRHRRIKNSIKIPALIAGIFLFI
jgi:hypothetical protein